MRPRRGRPGRTGERRPAPERRAELEQPHVGAAHVAGVEHGLAHGDPAEPVRRLAVRRRAQLDGVPHVRPRERLAAQGGQGAVRGVALAPDLGPELTDRRAELPRPAPRRRGRRPRNAVAARPTAARPRAPAATPATGAETCVREGRISTSRSWSPSRRGRPARGARSAGARRGLSGVPSRRDLRSATVADAVRAMPGRAIPAVRRDAPERYRSGVPCPLAPATARRSSSRSNGIARTRPRLSSVAMSWLARRTSVTPAGRASGAVTIRRRSGGAHGDHHDVGEAGRRRRRAR